jgi:hypothetical protein
MTKGRVYFFSLPTVYLQPVASSCTEVKQLSQGNMYHVDKVRPLLPAAAGTGSNNKEHPLMQDTAIMQSTLAVMLLCWLGSIQGQHLQHAHESRLHGVDSEAAIFLFFRPVCNVASIRVLTTLQAHAWGIAVC